MSTDSPLSQQVEKLKAIAEDRVTAYRENGLFCVTYRSPSHWRAKGAHQSMKQYESLMSGPSGEPTGIPPGEFEAALATSQTERCKTCDSTGDVHDQTGEWRGECTACDVATVARLRAVCRLLGLETAVPGDDKTLIGCLFSVLGMIRRVIEQRTAEISRLTAEITQTAVQAQNYFLQLEAQQNRSAVLAAEYEVDKKDAGRYRWWRANHPITLMTKIFGNGCVNKTFEMVEAHVDAAMTKEKP